MPEPIQSFTTRVSGRWNPRHTFKSEEGLQGVLTYRRNPAGMVVGGEYVPEAGERYSLRRDPGLLRSQFSMWTDGREWLGSSLRWSFGTRSVALSTGTKPFRLLPLTGFRRGWGLYAPRTGEQARFEVSLLGRNARLQTFRRLDFSLLLFAYFLGSQIYPESFWPGPRPAEATEG